MILILISVQLALDLPTGTELGKNQKNNQNTKQKPAKNIYLSKQFNMIEHEIYLMPFISELTSIISLLDVFKKEKRQDFSRKC